MKDSDDPKTILAKEIENRKHGTETYKIVRDEPVNGQPTTLYSLHSKTERVTGEAQIWISKGTGFVLREEMDIDWSGTVRKSLMSTSYEYGNIQPPMRSRLKIARAHLAWRFPRVG